MCSKGIAYLFFVLLDLVHVLQRYPKGWLGTHSEHHRSSIQCGIAPVAAGDADLLLLLAHTTAACKEEQLVYSSPAHEA